MTGGVKADLRLAHLSRARELSAYQNEPAQMAAGAPGKRGYLHLAFEKRGEKSILARLHRIAPLLVQQALYWDEEMPELPICTINALGGGVLQGDRLTIEVDVGADATAQVITQGANRVHQMDANHAVLSQELRLRARAYLEFMPDVTIPYAQARYLSRTRIVLPDNATAIVGETLMPGRKHRGEKFTFDVVSLATHVERPDGTPLFSEKLLIEPAKRPVWAPGVMQEFDVFGNLLILTSPDTAARIAARVAVDFPKGARAASGLCVLPNAAGLIFRVVAQESHEARARLRDCWRIAREETVGRTLPPEFLWR